MEAVPLLLAFLHERGGGYEYIHLRQVRVRKTAQRPTKHVHCHETKVVARHVRRSATAKSIQTLLSDCRTQQGRDIQPGREALEEVFAKSEKIWQGHVKEAQATQALPISVLHPSTLLHRIPALPNDLRGRHFVDGHSIWEAVAEQGCDFHQQTEGNLRIPLGVRHPTVCEIAHLPEHNHFCGKESARDGSLGNSIAVLTLAWAYIFCAELLHRQGRSMQYSESSARIVLPNDNYRQHGLTVNVGCSSAQELRWWTQILGHGIGWYASSGLSSRSQPPWWIEFRGPVELQVEIEALLLPELCSQIPPSSVKAAEWLSTFCQRNHLMPQSAAAFAVVLTLPLHNLMRTTVRLPRSGFVIDFSEDASKDLMEDFQHLSYYMTLSASPGVFASMLWSIFWEPGIDCNLVDAWFTPILDIFDAYSSTLKNYELLVKVLALRRPKLGSLWLGLALGGPTKTMKGIRAFLRTSESPLACANPDVAAWTGIPQSFMDLTHAGAYATGGSILRSDVWRLRHDCSLAGNVELEDLPFKSSPLSPWPPCGTISSSELESPVARHVESCARHQWKFKHWVWHNQDGTMDAGFTSNDSCLSWGEKQDKPFDERGQKPRDGFHIRKDIIASQRATSHAFGWASCQTLKGESLRVYSHSWLKGFIKEERASGLESSDRQSCQYKIITTWLDKCQSPHGEEDSLY